MVVHQGRKLVADLKDREGLFELMTTSSKEKLLQSRDPSDVTKFVSMRRVQADIDLEIQPIRHSRPPHHAGETYHPIRTKAESMTSRQNLPNPKPIAGD